MEKIFDEISAKQDIIKLKLEAQIDELMEKVMSVIDIREVELPDYESKIAFTQERMNKLSRYLVRQKFDGLNLQAKKNVWLGLTDHAKESKREKAKI